MTKLDLPGRADYVKPVPAGSNCFWMWRALALLLATAPLSALATSLSDNGTPNQLDAMEMTAWIRADDFTLTAPARIETVTFWNIEASDAFDGSIVWFIYANSPSNLPGSLVASGTGGNLSRSATGYTTAGYPEFLNTFDLGRVSLPPATYWLGLHNGPLTTDTKRRFYWSTSNHNNTLLSAAREAPFNGSWYTITFPGWSPSTEFAFIIHGTPAATVRSIEFIDQALQITFTTSANRSYSVQYKNALADSIWRTVPGAETVPGTGNNVSIQDPNVGNRDSRFYRILLL